MANLFQPIAADSDSAPIVIRVALPASNQMMVGGVPAGPAKIEPYVLLSALPEELRRRVELAVQALVTGR